MAEKLTGSTSRAGLLACLLAHSKNRCLLLPSVHVRTYMCGLPRYPEKCTHRYCADTKVVFRPSMAECTELLLPNNRFLIPPAKRLPSQDRSSSLCFRTVSFGHFFFFFAYALLILPIFYLVVFPILARAAATSNSQSMRNVYDGNKRARASKSQMTNGAAKRGNSYVSSVLKFLSPANSVVPLSIIDVSSVIGVNRPETPRGATKFSLAEDPDVRRKPPSKVVRLR